MSDAILKRSVIIAGHRTSVSLEPEFWTALKDIARRRSLSINDLVTEVDKGRRGNLSSALRVFVLATVQGQLSPAAPPTPAAPTSAPMPALPASERDTGS
ncbi:MAG: ribbon-helix-helix domain-containing protein [Rhodospirillales bacterium]|nr:ribbon-helix-helix domain-containing protein [Rhodospirillales bacterium]